MKILISAAEVSSDVHGAELLKALRGLTTHSVEAFGVGGPRLQAAGLRTVVDARELLAMGFTEILGRLPRILRALGEVEAAARAERPDVAVVIDYPDFHFRLARRLKRLGIPVVYYIPPKVWAWRRGRVRFLRDFFARVLCILPFEAAFYRDEGVAVTYVGSPLADELPLRLTRAEARSQLGIAPHERVLLLMPGSRPAEIRRHLAVMIGAAAAAQHELGGELTVLIPLCSVSGVREEAEALAAGSRLRLRLFEGHAHECMVAADSGLIKSGTSTLEAAVLGCPHAVVYATSAISRWIYRWFVRYRGPVGLVNLVAGRREGDALVAREILLEAVTVEALMREAISLLADEARVAQMRVELRDIRERLFGPGGLPTESPSARAAREVLAVAELGAATGSTKGLGAASETGGNA